MAPRLTSEVENVDIGLIPPQIIAGPAGIAVFWRIEWFSTACLTGAGRLS